MYQRLAVTVFVIAALSACASPNEERPLSLSLGEGRSLTLRLPPSWSATPSFEYGAGPPRVGLVRLSSRVGEQPQLRFAPRAEPTPRSRMDAAALEARARQELQRSGECVDVDREIKPRPLAGGVAVYCTRPASSPRPSTLLPTTAGVLATETMTVRFAVLDAADDVQTAAWAILGSLRLNAVQLSN